MVGFYDYKESIITFNGVECYQFSRIAKPECKEHKTVIKYLATVFNKENMAVLNRQYLMRYKSILFQFDVKINVKTKCQTESSHLYQLAILDIGTSLLRPKKK